MRVLVAEPERRLAGVIGQGLKEEGHSVEAALDGEAVLERLAEDPPYDLVVLDVALPRRDGLDVVRVLREHRIEALVLLLTERDRTSELTPRWRSPPSSMSSSRECARFSGGDPLTGRRCSVSAIYPSTPPLTT